MKKKYTMEEFKEMFDNAKMEALEVIDKKFREAKGMETQPEAKEEMFYLLNSMQNMIAFSELEKILFEEK